VTQNPLTIGILLFDGVEELDAVGPWEVLASWARTSPLSPAVRTFTRDGLGVRCSHGMHVLADTSAEDLGPPHVLVHPGGPGARALAADSEHLAWVRSLRPLVPLMASVCTGALVYAAAGLLSGRSATTHHASLDLLAEIDPAVLVDGEARVVDDGDLVTSAGVTAGIDMALHLVARLDSVEAAEQERRRLQYDA